MATKPTYIPGSSAFYHDSAACLLADGNIVAAARKSTSLGRRATRHCRSTPWLLPGIGGDRWGELTAVGYYDKPLLKFDRILETPPGRRASRLSFLPQGGAALAEAEAVDRSGNSTAQVTDPDKSHRPGGARGGRLGPRGPG